MALRRIRAVVAERWMAGHDVVGLVLRDPDGWDLPPFRPGAHLDLYMPGLVRTYSLVNPPAHNDRYVVAVKREATGRGGSRLICDTLEVGSEIGVGLPRGGLPLGEAPQVFIAGGIGVTPFLSAVGALMAQDRQDFRLHVLARGAPPLAEALAPLVATGLAHVHDTAAGARPRLDDLLAPYRDTDAVASCCGPEGLLAAFEAATVAWPRSRVHVERFVPPPLTAPPEAVPYTLVLARSGARIDIGAGESMLDALAQKAIAVPHSCCGGICGLCRVDWLDGQPLHRDRALTAEERKRTLLACVALSAGPELVVDL